MISVRNDQLRLAAGSDIEAGSIMCGASDNGGLAIVLRTPRPGGGEAIHLLRIDDPAKPYLQYIDQHYFFASSYGCLGKPEYRLFFDRWPDARASRTTSVEIGAVGARLLIEVPNHGLAAVSISDFSMHQPDEAGWSVRTTHWQLRARFDGDIPWDQSTALIKVATVAQQG